jgi:hypothetical protein
MVKFRHVSTPAERQQGTDYILAVTLSNVAGGEGRRQAAKFPGSSWANRL